MPALTTFSLIHPLKMYSKVGPERWIRAFIARTDQLSLSPQIHTVEGNDQFLQPGCPFTSTCMPPHINTKQMYFKILKMGLVR